MNYKSFYLSKNTVDAPQSSSLCSASFFELEVALYAQATGPIAVGAVKNGEIC